MSVQLVVFDMAGTTVEDGGLVQQAFLAADEHAGLSRTPAEGQSMLRYVVDTMGQSKIEVFRHLTGGDEEQAQDANKAFELSYARLVGEGQCTQIPGAAEVIGELRRDGIKTALTTGFAHETQQVIIDTLGWRDLADTVLCPGDGIRGRPFPDMPLTALMRTGTESVRQMVVVGDTASDVLSGVRAGALAVVGVRTGAHGDDQLRAAGATHVIDSVVALPALLDTLS